METAIAPVGMTKDTATSDARTIVERYLREILNGERPTTSDELISNETFRQRVEAFRRSFPDLVVTPQVVVASGDYVAVHLSGRATHRGIFQGVPATGRAWSATCSAVYRVEDGRIADFWVNWDVLAILEQLGAVQRPAAASA
jgi:steroid delta-isomerase-like uncharacterized protein